MVKRHLYPDQRRLKSLLFFEKLVEGQKRGFRDPDAYAEKATRISRASAYRWRETKEEFPVVEVPIPDVPNVDISNSLEILNGNGDVSDTGFIIAALDFMSWMRFPRENENYLHCKASMIIRYAMLKDHCTSFSRMRVEFLNELDKMYSLYVTSQFIHPLYYPKTPYFYDEIKMEGEADTFDIMTNIVAYLISKPEDRITRINLKAVKDHLIDQNLRVEYPVSRISFYGLWNKMSSSSPFVYVAKQRRVFNCLLYPYSPNFAQDVDVWFGDRKILAIYFGHARWIAGQLDARLTPKERARAQLPDFPKDLQSLAFELPLHDSLISKGEDTKKDNGISILLCKLILI